MKNCQYILVVLFALFSCSNDNPNKKVSFNKTIKPILEIDSLVVLNGSFMSEKEKEILRKKVSKADSSIIRFRYGFEETYVKLSNRNKVLFESIISSDEGAMLAAQVLLNGNDRIFPLDLIVDSVKYDFELNASYRYLDIAITEQSEVRFVHSNYKW